MTTKLPKSKLAQNQRKVLKKEYVENGKIYKQFVYLRFDNSNWNGHNEFAITSDIYEGGKYVSWWANHDDIVRNFPELKKYIKRHLVSADGPLYYIVNTLYLAKNGDLEWARGTAIFPEATLEELKNETILKQRLPGLMEEFKKDMEELGFVY